MNRSLRGVGAFNLHWVEWTIIAYSMFGPPIIIVEVSYHYNSYFSIVKQFENLLYRVYYFVTTLASFLIHTKIVGPQTQTIITIYCCNRHTIITNLGPKYPKVFVWDES